MWTKKKECKEIIEAAWCTGNDLNSLNGIASALFACAVDLKAWSSVAFGQIPKVIQEKRKKLSSLIQHDNDGSLGEEINQTRKEINDLLNSELGSTFKKPLAQRGRQEYQIFFMLRP